MRKVKQKILFSPFYEFLLPTPIAFKRIWINLFKFYHLTLLILPTPAPFSLSSIFASLVALLVRHNWQSENAWFTTGWCRFWHSGIIFVNEHNPACKNVKLVLSILPCLTSLLIPVYSSLCIFTTFVKQHLRVFCVPPLAAKTTQNTPNYCMCSLV